MEQPFTTVIERCRSVLESLDAQSHVEAILREAAKDPAIVDAISKRTEFASLEDLAIYRSDRLTLLAGALPPGFSADRITIIFGPLSVCALGKKQSVLRKG